MLKAAVAPTVASTSLSTAVFALARVRDFFTPAPVRSFACLPCDLRAGFASVPGAELRWPNGCACIKFCRPGEGGTVTVCPLMTESLEVVMLGPGVAGGLAGSAVADKSRVGVDARAGGGNEGRFGLRVHVNKA